METNIISKKYKQKVSSSAHIEFHARIILQKFIQRSLIKISNEIITDSYDETKDVFDLLDNAESKLYDVTQGNIKKSSESAQSLVIQAKNKIESVSNKEGLSGVASGFSKIDKLNVLFLRHCVFWLLHHHKQITNTTKLLSMQLMKKEISSSRPTMV